jgi:hypothetical protein
MEAVVATLLFIGNGRVRVIPAPEEIQLRGTPWIPVYAAMTILSWCGIMSRGASMHVPRTGLVVRLSFPQA